MIEVGNWVRVIDETYVYPSYENWIIANAHEYYEEWYQSTKKRFLPDLNTKAKVLVKANHLDFEDEVLYLVKVRHLYFIIGEKGLENEKEKN